MPAFKEPDDALTEFSEKPSLENRPTAKTPSIPSGRVSSRDKRRDQEGRRYFRGRPLRIRVLGDESKSRRVRGKEKPRDHCVRRGLGENRRGGSGKTFAQIFRARRGNRARRVFGVYGGGRGPDTRGRRGSGANGRSTRFKKTAVATSGQSDQKNSKGGRTRVVCDPLAGVPIFPVFPDPLGNRIGRGTARPRHGVFGLFGPCPSGASASLSQPGSRASRAIWSRRTPCLPAPYAAMCTAGCRRKPAF